MSRQLYRGHHPEGRAQCDRLERSPGRGEGPSSQRPELAMWDTVTRLLTLASQRRPHND